MARPLTGRRRFLAQLWGWAEPLLMAYHATADAKYLGEFDRLFGQWYEQRDTVRDAIIWDGLGLGLRSHQFLHYYTCPFAQRPLATHERMLKTMLATGRSLSEYCMTFQSGNHQLSASYGLVDIGVRLPEFREAGHWRDAGIARLRDHIEREFYADGCHSERVPTSYMPIAYHGPRNLLVLLRAAGVQTEATALFRERLEKVLEWWMWAATPLGTLPALGDSGDDNRFVVLMLPFAKAALQVEFTAAPSPPGTACVTLRRGDRTDTLVFGSGRPLTLLDGRLATDGRFAWLRMQDGAWQGRVVGGAVLTWKGRAVKAMD